MARKKVTILLMGKLQWPNIFLNRGDTERTEQHGEWLETFKAFLRETPKAL
jgi:hypothetical protein